MRAPGRSFLSFGESGGELPEALALDSDICVIMSCKPGDPQGQAGSIDFPICLPTTPGVHFVPVISNGHTLMTKIDVSPGPAPIRGRVPLSLSDSMAVWDGTDTFECEDLLERPRSESRLLGRSGNAAVCDLFVFDM
jgi:hypothetical protein